MNMDKLKNLDPLLQKEVDAGNLLGAGVTIGRSSGPVYTACAGDIGPDTFCMLCSMTKPITSIAAWILIERGLIDPWDDISLYLPGFKNPQVLQDGMLVPAQRGIQIQDLFNMTSGITYGMTPNLVPGMPTWQSQQINKTWKERVRSGEKLSMVDMVNEMGQIPLIFQPGDHWAYGKSADVVAAIVEAVSGMTFGEFLKKEIFDPLEMKDTGFVFPREQCEGRIAGILTADGKEKMTGKDFYGDGLELWDTPYMENGGGGAAPILGRGLYSTLEDYAKFTMMLLRGGEYKGKRILSEATVKQFSLNHLSEAQMRTLWPWMKGYGYGNLMRVMIDPAMQYTNGSAGEFGWDGALGTYMFVDPEADLYGVYMQQRAGGQIRRKIRNIAYSAIED